MTTLLKIHLKDGRTISGQADFGKGSPADPMSFDEVAVKFRGCAEFAGWPHDKTEKVIELTQRLENMSDVGKLASLRSR